MKKWLNCVLVLLVLHLHPNVAFENDFEEPFSDNSGDDAARINTIDVGNRIDKKPPKPPKKPFGKMKESPMGAIGQGFELHKMDLMTEQLQSTGAKIFENLDLDNCVGTNKIGTTQKDSRFFSDTHALYSAISTDTHLDATLKGTYTLGVSVSAVTNNIAMANKEVSGVSLNLVARTYRYGLSKDCINNVPLSQDLILDFESLPSEVNEPWKSESWQPYRTLLRKYGSHIVQDVISGSSIYQYIFAESSKKYTQRDLTVKACISLAGPTQAGKLDVAACSTVSQTEIEASTSVSVIEKAVFRGGSSKTRAKLSDQVTVDLITELLREGASRPKPILYKFYALWEILEIRYGNTKHAAKVFNLLQFYKGFLSFECDYQESHNQKVVMQKFELSPDSNPATPIYQCTLGPQSCHDNSDCHYENAFWCSCAGESCIRYKSQSLNTGTIKKVAYVESARRQWGWHGCKYHHAFRCKCDNPASYREISWSGRGALEDMHVKLPSKKTRIEAAGNAKSRYLRNI